MLFLFRSGAKLFWLWTPFVVAWTSACNPLGPQSNIETDYLAGAIDVATGPTISDISSTSTNEDVAKSVTFVIDDPDSQLSCTSDHLSAVSSNSALLSAANIAWSGTAPNCTATLTPIADQFGISTITIRVSDGTQSATDTFVLTVNQLADENVTGTWSFDEGSDSSYLFDSAKIELIDGIARLKNTLVDQDNSGAQFGGGSHVGTWWDGSKIALDPAGTPLNHGSLDSSWTPKWNNLIHYWKFDGNYNDSVGSWTLSATGHAGRAAAAAKSGSQGAVFDGNGDMLSASVGAVFPAGTIRSETIMAWFQSRGDSQGAILPGVFAITDGLNEQLGALATDFTQTKISCRSVFEPSITLGAGSVEIHRNTWYHITCTTIRVGGNVTLKMHINGQLVGSNTAARSAYDDPSTQIRVGAQKTTNVNRVWNGYIDEVAYFDTPLDDQDVKKIYDRQKAAFSGTFTSRVMDGGGSRAWYEFEWRSLLPFFKEIPDDGSSESASKYSGLHDSALLTGLRGLWHLNGTVGAVTDDAVVADGSGRNHPGSAKDADGTNTLQYVSGQFQQAMKFDGTDDYVSIADHADFAGDSLTVMGWIAAYPQTSKAVFGQWESGLNKRAWSIWSDKVDSTGKLRVLISESGDTTSMKEYLSSSVVLDSAFHHVAFTFNQGVLKLFVDGVEDTAVVKTRDDPITAIFDSDVAIQMAASLSSGVASNFFSGYLDEFAIWNRALDPAEIAQIYRRGASRVKYQVRSCDDSACSGESWIGPDGTNETFFSELHNNTVPSSGTGAVQSFFPRIRFADFGSVVGNNPYFQYRAILETDSSIANSPHLTVTKSGPVVSATAPTIQNQTPISFFELASFTEVLGAGSCGGGLKYQISRDGTNWFYYNSGWVAATPASDLYAEASTAASIHANASTFPAQDGSFYFKAFLNSNGTQVCEISSVGFSGAR